MAIQADLRERNAALPADRRVEFRIGINLGEVMVDRNDIYGDGVNVAARLEGVAEAGGICVPRPFSTRFTTASRPSSNRSAGNGSRTSPNR